MDFILNPLGVDVSFFRFGIKLDRWGGGKGHPCCGEGGMLPVTSGLDSLCSMGFQNIAKSFT